MTWLKNLIDNNAVAIMAVIITPFLAWLFSRRKESSDINKVDTDNKKTYAEGTNILINSGGEVVKSWQEFAVEMKDEYRECRENNIALAKRLDKVENYTKALEKYSNAITSILNGVLDELEKSNPDLARENRDRLAKVVLTFQEVEKIDA